MGERGAVRTVGARQGLQNTDVSTAAPGGGQQHGVRADSGLSEAGVHVGDHLSIEHRLEPERVSGPHHPDHVDIAVSARSIDETLRGAASPHATLFADTPADRGDSVPSFVALSDGVALAQSGFARTGVEDAAAFAAEEGRVTVGVLQAMDTPADLLIAEHPETSTLDVGRAGRSLDAALLAAPSFGATIGVDGAFDAHAGGWIADARGAVEGVDAGVTGLAATAAAPHARLAVGLVHAADADAERRVADWCIGLVAFVRRGTAVSWNALALQAARGIRAIRWMQALHANPQCRVAARATVHVSLTGGWTTCHSTLAPGSIRRAAGARSASATLTARHGGEPSRAAWIGADAT